MKREWMKSMLEAGRHQSVSEQSWISKQTLLGTVVGWMGERSMPVMDACGSLEHSASSIGQRPVPVPMSRTCLTVRGSRRAK